MQQRISIDLKVFHEQACIRGTRILNGAGNTVGQLTRNFVRFRVHYEDNVGCWRELIKAKGVDTIYHGRDSRNPCKD